MTQETRLTEWSQIKTQILLARDIVELGKLNYSLEAIQKWAKQSQQSLEAQNEIAEYRIRLNRRQGEWIRDNIPEEGYSNLPTENGRQDIPTLAEAGIDKHDSPKFRALANIPEERFEALIKQQKDGAELTMASVYSRIKAHVSNNSGESEWYTPPEYIQAALNTMGSIDCDPASSEIANKIVQAKIYFSLENDGLKQQWAGNVWLNPPYSQPAVSDFCIALVEKRLSTEITQACVLVNNATETAFYQGILRMADAVCFIKGRVKFLDKDGNPGAPLQGQTVLYFGANITEFTKHFSQFGVILYASK